MTLHGQLNEQVLQRKGFSLSQKLRIICQVISISYLVVVIYYPTKGRFDRSAITTENKTHVTTQDKHSVEHVTVTWWSSHPRKPKLSCCKYAQLYSNILRIIYIPFFAFSNLCCLFYSTQIVTMHSYYWSNSIEQKTRFPSFFRLSRYL